VTTPRWQAGFAALLLASVTGIIMLARTVGGDWRLPTAPSLATSDADTVSALLLANNTLRQEMERLDKEIQNSKSGRGVRRLEEMARTLNALRVVNGEVAVVGPGAEVRLSGDFSAASIRDLVNELKSAGAEALAIDGRRLTVWSAIYEGESQVLVDGHQLGDTVTLHAIGDMAILRSVMERPDGLVALLEAAGTQVVVEERLGANEIRLPVLPRRKVFKYAETTVPGS